MNSWARLQDLTLIDCAPTGDPLRPGKKSVRRAAIKIEKSGKTVDILWRNNKKIEVYPHGH